ncbi:hypothetical protein EB796_000552 [Bugula neritina]|uniref:Uncharacterized protein n=1 Tax=Bugula neritina TaxID=10212 RepID=A0A7J7KSM2_BUGNE|nr:hypothetical protein EB796_000552 [Bugula neritina]
MEWWCMLKELKACADNLRHTLFAGKKHITIEYNYTTNNYSTITDNNYTTSNYNKLYCSLLNINKRG